MDNNPKRRKVKNFYAIRIGRENKIILPDWGQAKPLVDKFPGAEFRGFYAIENAGKYLNGEPVDEQLEIQARMKKPILHKIKSNS
jgi:viroplasmin and RNaseH domain-containing protein